MEEIRKVNSDQAQSDRRVPVDRLTPNQRTALVVLYQRAKESRKQDGKIKDSWAEEMVDRIDYDFSELDNDLRGQEVIAVRTQVFDRETNKFAHRRPDGTIVNLGAGLDTRFFRIDNGTIRWFDIDLPEMIDLRRQFISESKRLSFISKSVLDFGWMDRVPKDSPILFVAEGLLVYFEEHDVRSLMGRLGSSFPGTEILFDAMSPMCLRATCPGIDPALTPFRWGVSTLKELEAWDPRIRVVEEWFSEDFSQGSCKLFADMLGLMVRPDAKVGRVEFGRDTGREGRFRKRR